MPVGIRAQGLGYEVGGHVLLSAIDLHIEPGQLCAIIGPSGSGKSTLLKSLCGIRRPTRGRVLLGDTDASKIERSPDLIGYVPQDDIVHKALRVERVLQYAAQLRLGRSTDGEQRRRVEDVLKLLGLSDRKRVRVRRLSGGQRKRVSIAVELITEPEVLFLDEPTSGLDPGLERQMMHTLCELAHDKRTVVLTTHVMESMDVVDQLIVIYDGHLAYSGSPAGALEFFRVDTLRLLFEQLAKRPASAWSQAYRRERAGGVS